jgi:snurportin-1
MREPVKTSNTLHLHRRRREALELQRNARSVAVNARRMVEVSDTEMDSDAWMDVETNTPIKKRVKVHIQQSTNIDNIQDVPSDLENYYILLCPKGKRCLVFERNGKTFALKRNGEALFPNSTPLGTPFQGLPSHSTLDCIHVPSNDSMGTFFVLDCLAWKGMPLVDSDAEFR